MLFCTFNCFFPRLLTRHDPARRSGEESFKILRGRVRSSQEVFLVPRAGSDQGNKFSDARPDPRLAGRERSGQEVFRVPTDRVGSGQEVSKPHGPDPTRSLKIPAVFFESVQILRPLRTVPNKTKKKSHER